MKVFIGILLALVLLGMAVGCKVNLAETERASDKIIDSDWENDARKYGLNDEQISILEKNNILVTGETHKQFYDIYKEGGEVPFFITSDSVLHIYNTFLEETVMEEEELNTEQLPKILKFLWENLNKSANGFSADDKLALSARKRAQYVIGVAMQLLNIGTPGIDKEFADQISEEVSKVKNANNIGRSRFLDIELEYGRYKPRSFYTRSVTLQDYFRAVSWLQSIHFALNKDDELLSILMLGDLLSGYSEEVSEYCRFFRKFSSFIGRINYADINTASVLVSQRRDAYRGKDFNRIRSDFIDTVRRGGDAAFLINDLLFNPTITSSEATELGFRVMSAYTTPDEILFQKTTDLRKFNRPHPNGLEICIALGSEYARSKISYEDKDKLLGEIDASKSFFQGDSLYQQYLNCLSTLIDEPEPDAPAFMRNESWQIKSCQSVLSGWVPLKHAWILHGGVHVGYKGISKIRPFGFVEPEPEFYARMRKLAQSTINIVGRDHRWKQLFDISVMLESIAHKQLRGVSFSEKENAFIFYYGRTLRQIAAQKIHADKETGEDNIPYVSDVSVDPNSNSVLEVATGRPQAIYVLYPTKKGNYLCRGAVLPYYEFVQPLNKRLTDKEWRILLDSPKCPQRPEWANPIFNNQPLLRPNNEKIK